MTGRCLYLKRRPMFSWETYGTRAVQGRYCMDYTKFHVQDSIQLGPNCLYETPKTWDL